MIPAAASNVLPERCQADIMRLLYMALKADLAADVSCQQQMRVSSLVVDIMAACTLDGCSSASAKQHSIAYGCRTHTAVGAACIGISHTDRVLRTHVIIQHAGANACERTGACLYEGCAAANIIAIRINGDRTVVARQAKTRNSQICHCAVWGRIHCRACPTWIRCKIGRGQLMIP